MNSSQVEIDLSFRRQNYHKSGGFVASLSLVDSYCWITNFFHMVKPGTKSFLLPCLFVVFCQTVTTWFELTLMALPKLFLLFFQQNCWTVSKAEAVVCDFMLTRSLHKQLKTPCSGAMTQYLSDTAFTSEE